MLDVLVHGPVHEIRLARAPANALDTDLLAGLRDAVAAAPGNGAQAIVLSSSSPAFFSGGMDVPHLMALDDAGMTGAWRNFFAACRAIAGSPVPVAAAITGHAPAGGCVLALCSDYRVMARGNARIGLNETQVGLAVPEAIQHLLRRVVGAYRAERLIVAGAMVDAATAERIGLVDELTDVDHVATRARVWLEELLALPRAPMLASRAIARADLVRALAAFSDADLDAFLAQWHAPDTQAALRALVLEAAQVSARRTWFTRAVRLSGAIVLLALAACSSKPVPKEYSDLVGRWDSRELQLGISADGMVDYHRTKKGGDVAINAPIQEYRADGFTAGIGPFKTDFKVNERPYEINGVWWMTFDGVPVQRVPDPELAGRRD